MNVLQDVAVLGVLVSNVVRSCSSAGTVLPVITLPLASVRESSASTTAQFPDWCLLLTDKELYPDTSGTWSGMSGCGPFVLGCGHSINTSDSIYGFREGNPDASTTDAIPGLRIYPYRKKLIITHMVAVGGMLVHQRVHFTSNVMVSLPTPTWTLASVKEIPDASTTAQFPDWGYINTSSTMYPVSNGAWGGNLDCGAFMFGCYYGASGADSCVGFRAEIPDA